jgi:hypothetical protein
MRYEHLYLILYLAEFVRMEFSSISCKSCLAEKSGDLLPVIGPEAFLVLKRRLAVQDYVP